MPAKISDITFPITISVGCTDYRKNESVDDFKSKLDIYLQLLPKEPYVEGLTPSACDMYSAGSSNSIIDQARTSQQRRPDA